MPGDQYFGRRLFEHSAYDLDIRAAESHRVLQAWMDDALRGHLEWLELAAVRMIYGNGSALMGIVVEGEPEVARDPFSDVVKLRMPHIWLTEEAPEPQAINHVPLGWRSHAG